MKNELLFAGAAAAAALSACTTPEGHPIPIDAAVNGVRIVRTEEGNPLGNKQVGIANGSFSIPEGTAFASVDIVGRAISIQCKYEPVGIRATTVYKYVVPTPFDAMRGLGGKSDDLNINAAGHCDDEAFAKLKEKLDSKLLSNGATPPVSHAYTQRWRKGRSA